MSRSSRPTEAPLLDGVTIWMNELQATGEDEYVTIKNIGTVAQPLTNWVLASLRGEQFYTFPEGTFLSPGESIQVHSGPGARNAPSQALFWTREPVWNNKHDTAVLFDANGHEVARLAHGQTRTDNQRAQLLYREDGSMSIEARAPHKMVKRRSSDAPSLEEPPR